MKEMKFLMVFLEQQFMGVFFALTSALTAFNPKSVNVDNEKKCNQTVCKTMGKFWLSQRTYRKVWVIL
jgi:citrate synthase